MIHLINIIFGKKKNIYKVWLQGDPHVQGNVNFNGFNSISEPIAQVEGINGFDYDFSLHVGDFGSLQHPPTLADTDEGELVVSSFATSSHPGAHFYRIAGNHDAGDGNVDWFLRYCDPLGDNTAFSGVDTNDRPYPITLMEAGSWHSYYVTFGNNIALMISDRNELPGPYGRGGLISGNGGYPSGTITLQTWNWMKSVILANTNKNIFVCTHQNPRNTTIGTPDNDGPDGCFHSKTTGQVPGGGSIYAIYDEDTPANTDDATDQILNFFSSNPNHTVVAWFCGHTHTSLDETYNGRDVKNTTNGVQFLNIANTTNSFYNSSCHDPIHSKSWRMIVDEGANTATFELFLHQVVGVNQIGFYSPSQFTISLKV